MSIPNVVIIPTRDHAETMCMDLIEQLLTQDEVDRIFVYDNRTIPFPETGDGVFDNPRLHWMSATGATITQMWNRGWRAALDWTESQHVNVAFLNDDIVIPDKFMSTLARFLREDNTCTWLTCPDYLRPLEAGIELRDMKYVSGTFRQHGWCGWAFMIRGELLNDPLPPFDEQFIWWCGDDDLDRQIGLHGGFCGLVEGLPLDHAGTATGRLHPELDAVGWEDMKRFEEKYR